MNFLEKRERLADPVATTGDQLYVICSQNGLFPTPWATNHLPHELWGVWAHPIKLLDGFWLAIRNCTTGVVTWLLEADACRVYGAHTEFDYRVEPLTVTRRDFVPDGMAGLIVTVTVQLPPAFADELECIALLRSDLRPAWLGETVGMQDTPDQVKVVDQQGYLQFSDTTNPWFLLAGGSTPARTILLGDAAGVLQPTTGQGATARMAFGFHSRTRDTLIASLYIAGSVTSAAEALEVFAQLYVDAGRLRQTKVNRYSRLAQQARLQSPDTHLNQAFHWSKLSCQMLARQTPAYGPAVSAGLPSYPWWFGVDTEYAVLPMLQAGLFDLVKSTLRLLKQVSKAHNRDEPGRDPRTDDHRRGLQLGNLVETPLFTRAVYQTWCWTGDRVFLAEMYSFCKAGVLDYTLGRCDSDGDLCPSGRSIIETLEMHAGFACIDLACYTWEALLFLAEMARIVGDSATVDLVLPKADELADRIRREWWLGTEGLFADVRATVQEVDAALQRIDALESDPGWQWMAPQAAQAHRLFDGQLQQRALEPPIVTLPWLLRHWVILCPMEVGVATPEQAGQAFARLLSNEFCNEWGMYLHPERHDVMSINTGLLALALARYGQVEEALKLIGPMAATLSQRTPGAISEALPDQWCFLQLWSALGIISPIVEGVLGITPHAGERTLQVIPHLPADWPTVTLEQLQVGEHWFTIQVTRSAVAQAAGTQAGVAYRLTVKSNAPDYGLVIGFYLPPAETVVTVRLNGSTTPWRWETTPAGRRLLCDAVGQAELVMTTLGE
ncbi:MAG: hypothetical protein R3E79_47215 [Caldilineaceae bacterium]